MNWQSDAAGFYELQQATDVDFNHAKTIYSGADQASVMSGLADGDYFYRVRVNQQRWSEPVQVTVQHHSLTRAFAFFALGILIFIVLIIVILKSEKQVGTD